MVGTVRIIAVTTHVHATANVGVSNVATGFLTRTPRRRQSVLKIPGAEVQTQPPASTSLDITRVGNLVLRTFLLIRLRFTLWCPRPLRVWRAPMLHLILLETSTA